MFVCIYISGCMYLLVFYRKKNELKKNELKLCEDLGNIIHIIGEIWAYLFL